MSTFAPRVGIPSSRAVARARDGSARPPAANRPRGAAALRRAPSAPRRARVAAASTPRAWARDDAPARRDASSSSSALAASVAASHPRAPLSPALAPGRLGARASARASRVAAIPAAHGDEGDDASSPAAARHVPTGRSAFVLAFVVAAVGVTCYFASKYTVFGQAAYGALSKSGFTAAFALIFISELGDKTFFIAALLAMRHGRSIALVGAFAALCFMSVISVVIGQVFQKIPSTINDTLPIGEYGAVALLLFFGVRTLREALDAPDAAETDEDSGELADAKDAMETAARSAAGKRQGLFAKLCETFTLVFIAEWGDRSMLATIALGAAQNPLGVATGASAGHLLATAIAVVGGALLSKKISERQVGIWGGTLFILFAFATLAGVF